MRAELEQAADAAAAAEEERIHSLREAAEAAAARDLKQTEAAAEAAEAAEGELQALRKQVRPHECQVDRSQGRRSRCGHLYITSHALLLA